MSRSRTKAQGQGQAIYRFGRPGRVELEVTDLHLAHRGFSGGGEEQVLADTLIHRYIVYTEISRTAFGPDGHHDPQAESGLFVQRGGQTISSQRCAEPTTFKQVVWTLSPAGEYVPH